MFLRKSLTSILGLLGKTLADLDQFVEENETVYTELMAEANKIGDELTRAGRIRDKLESLLK